MNRGRARVVAAALAFCIARGAAAGVFDAATLADFSGEELFGQFCAACHGEHARGDGPVAASLNKVVPDLTGITARYGEFPAGLIRDTIDGRGVPVAAHGTRAMPVWGYEFWVEDGADIAAETTVREAINRLVEYLRTLQRDDPRNRRN
jgi:mono/diheme cytochrome c family protein